MNRLSRPGPADAVVRAARPVVERLENRCLLHGAGEELGSGLLARYYDNADFTNLKLTRTDSSINFWWASGSPAPSMGYDTYSVRWTGQVLAPTSEAMTFTAGVDDGARVWLNGKLIIDAFTAGSFAYHSSAPVTLVAGQKYNLQMDYFENTGRAGALLYWSSKSIPQEIIPTEHLFDGQTTTPPAAPTNLTGSAASATQMNLKWADNSDNESGFEVERSADGTNFVALPIAAANSTSYTDNTVKGETAYSYRVRATNAAGDSAYTNIVGPITTPNADTSSIIRIDVASSAAYTDASGKLWAKDAFFTGGTASTAAYDVANTTSDPLYYTRRWGNFDYHIPAQSGGYILNLHFADPIYTAAGMRKFNVTAEGASILSNFDIAASGGGKAALVKSFSVNISDGFLDLSFRDAGLDHAIVSGIELIPAAAATIPNAPSGLTASAVSSSQIRLNWVDNSSNETNFRVERSSDGVNFSQAALLAANTTTWTDSNLPGNTTYTYRVRAVNSAGASAPTNTASATTAPAPTGFTTITWTTKAAAPIIRAEALRGAVDGKLYVFGGFSGDLGPVTRSDVYDTATNTWTRIADLPKPITHAGVAVIGHDIYIAGGYIGTGPGYAQTFGSADVWRYNVDSNTYTAMPKLPLLRAGGGLVALGNELHYFGGDDINRVDTPNHYVLNLSGGTTWTTSTPMANAVSHMGYVNFGGKIYAIGGQHGNDAALTTQSTVQVWDPANPGQWTLKAPMPAAVSHISSSTFVMGGRIIVAGGESAHTVSVANVRAFDPGSNTWVSLTSLPAPRFSGVAAEIGGLIYFTGGSSQTTTWQGVPG